MFFQLKEDYINEAFGRNKSGGGENARRDELRKLEEKLRGTKAILSTEEKYLAEARRTKNQTAIDSHGGKIERLKEEIEKIEDRIEAVKTTTVD